MRPPLVVLTSANYWSSSELTSDVARWQAFSDGYQDGTVKSSFHRVRCVRTPTPPPAAPSGYGVAFTTDPLNAGNASAGAFQITGAEVGAAFSYAITSSGGGSAIRGAGAVASATHSVSGLNLSALPDGVLTVSVVLTNGGGSGAAVTDTVAKDTVGAGVWDYVVHDRDFTSAPGQAFTIESGTLRGAGRTTAFNPLAQANAARGTSAGDLDDFGIIYTSSFRAAVSGTYFFRTASDDGSTVRILDAGGVPLIWSNQTTGEVGLGYLNNDFDQNPHTRQASVTLSAGERYDIEIRFWENGGAQALSADVQAPGGGWQSLSNNPAFLGT